MITMIICVGLVFIVISVILVLTCSDSSLSCRYNDNYVLYFYYTHRTVLYCTVQLIMGTDISGANLYPSSVVSTLYSPATS